MSMDAVSLSRTIEEFILASPSPAVIEEGEVAFDFSNAKYSISTEHDRCLLHLWSAERNAMRRIIDAEQKPNRLRLTVQRFGQPKPARIEIVSERHKGGHTSAAQKLNRDQYQRLLERVLERNFPGSRIDPLTNRPDLEKSFGPVYSRGMIAPRAGRSAWACLGVNQDETQAAVDGSLSIGILWLDYLRERYAADRVIEGLKLFLPAGSSQIVRQRAAHLNHRLAKFEIWELDQQGETMERKDIFDHGNIATRLVRSTDEQRVRDRFAASIDRMRELVPRFEAVAVSSGELSFRLHGLEFASARSSYGGGNSLDLCDEIIFGVGPRATPLTPENSNIFRDMVLRVAHSRGGNSGNAPKDPLWRMQPERWLESMVAAAVDRIDERLSPAHVYSQVPAFSASDRAMIDVLCATHDRRLVVIELKAEEDIHLPLQGLDYWSRVRYHQERGEFAQYGYFPGLELSPEPPLLLLVAPALRIHPSTDTLLRYLTPAIDCTVIGLDERWRQELRVIFRKRAQRTFL